MTTEEVLNRLWGYFDERRRNAERRWKEKTSDTERAYHMGTWRTCIKTMRKLEELGQEHKKETRG